MVGILFRAFQGTSLQIQIYLWRRKACNVISSFARLATVQVQIPATWRQVHRGVCPLFENSAHLCREMCGTRCCFATYLLQYVCPVRTPSFANPELNWVIHCQFFLRWVRNSAIMCDRFWRDLARKSRRSSGLWWPWFSVEAKYYYSKVRSHLLYEDSSSDWRRSR